MNKKIEFIEYKYLIDDRKYFLDKILNLLKIEKNDIYENFISKHTRASLKENGFTVSKLSLATNNYFFFNLSRFIPKKLKKLLLKILSNLSIDTSVKIYNNTSETSLKLIEKNYYK